MKDKILLTLLLSIVAIYCSGQSFLVKYPKLTDRNLGEFFKDWEIYSDSVSSCNIIKDSILSDVVNRELAAFKDENKRQNSIISQYIVFPRTIEVERYCLDVDTIMAKSSQGFPVYIPDMKREQYSVDTITPDIPRGGLYLTPGIRKVLSEFAGGLKKGNVITEINKSNVKKLKKYIPVAYGHWGGYWWFVSFPIINGICYSDNLIAIMRRTSWCTGDVIWYVKENGKFVRRLQPVSAWIE